MCRSDLYPTEYNLKPVKLVSITDVEIQAVKLVDTVERTAEPITIYDVIRVLIKITAQLTRKVKRG